MLFVMRWSSLSHSALAALSLRVTWRRTKGIETVLALEGGGFAENMAESGEKIRGLGGCLRERPESDMETMGTFGRDMWKETRRRVELVFIL